MVVQSIHVGAHVVFASNPGLYGVMKVARVSGDRDRVCCIVADQVFTEMFDRSELRLATMAEIKAEEAA